jgi:hypothetical protein
MVEVVDLVSSGDSEEALDRSDGAKTGHIDGRYHGPGVEWNRNSEEAEDARGLALDMLVENAPSSLSEMDARRLLDDTREEYASQGIEAWVEACMVQMAVDNEIDDEARDVREAMRTSLQELESRPSSSQLGQLAGDMGIDGIIEYYKGDSQIASFLSARYSDSPWTDSKEDVKEELEDVKEELEELSEKKSELLSLLELERSTFKWYGSACEGFFQDIVDRLRRCTDGDGILALLWETLDLLQTELLVKGNAALFDEDVIDLVT